METAWIWSEDWIQGSEVEKVKGNLKNVGYKTSRWKNNSSNQRYRKIILQIINKFRFQFEEKTSLISEILSVRGT